MKRRDKTLLDKISASYFTIVFRHQNQNKPMNPFPIVAYGAAVLKKKATPVDLKDPELPALIERMWVTMYASSGVGLAAPQIGRSLRLFVIDGSPFAEDESLSAEEAEELKDFKAVFSIQPLLKNLEPPGNLMKAV